VAGFAKNTGLGVAGFVIMLLAIAELVRTLRRRSAVDRAPASPPAPAAPPPRRRPPGRGVESWWGKLTERWRQRWEERGGPPQP